VGKGNAETAAAAAGVEGGGVERWLLPWSELVKLEVVEAR
jgi:hypothetical protein